MFLRSLLNQILPFAFIIGLFTGSTPAYSQFELRSATVITQMDTLLGQVKFYDWDIMPKTIELLGPTGQQLQSIPDAAIKRMTIAPGKVFDGQFLVITNYNKFPRSIENGLVGRPDSGYYLPELLYESSVVRLYRLFDRKGVRRFYLYRDGRNFPLDDVHAQLTTNSGIQAYHNPRYQAMLKAVLPECPTLNTTINYDEGSLIRLLREYHLYCRIDAKTYLEQRETGQIDVSIGATGGLTPFFFTRNQMIPHAGLTAILGLPLRLRYYFILADLTIVTKPSDTNNQVTANFGLYVGRYFGMSALRPYLFTGISALMGPLETGVGMAYKQRLFLSTSLRLLNLIDPSLTNRGIDSGEIPAFQIRYVIPIKNGASEIIQGGR